MDNTFDSLNEAFNIVEETTQKIDKIEKPEIQVVEDRKADKSIDIGKDYEYTRGNLYSIIEKGQEAINGVLELAQETESPRAYEVLGQLIKNVSDTTDKLLDLQKKIKDIEEDKGSKGPTNVTNALFVGSTAELSKLLKQQKKSEEEQ